MVALSEEDLKQVEKLKSVLETKQLSKVVSYCLEMVGNMVSIFQCEDILKKS